MTNNAKRALIKMIKKLIGPKVEKLHIKEQKNMNDNEFVSSSSIP
ncbi:hypothetical protein [Alkalihalobacillus deserti]|nr:hypothetical protein [Alkalihalobacillus deserti]